MCSGVYRDDAYAQLMRLQDAALKGDDARAVYDWSWWEYRSGDGETFAAGEKLIDLYEAVERARRAVDQEDETLTDIESFKARRNVLSRELRELTSGTRADPDGPEAALARATCARTPASFRSLISSKYSRLLSGSSCTGREWVRGRGDGKWVVWG